MLREACVEQPKAQVNALAYACVATIPRGSGQLRDGNPCASAADTTLCRPMIDCQIVEFDRFPKACVMEHAAKQWPLNDSGCNPESVVAEVTQDLPAV
jgi:hypothetical protein